MERGIGMEIFIAGSSRSGTTLVSRILGRHDRVHTLPELHFFEEIWRHGQGSATVGADHIDAVAELLATAEGGYLRRHDPAMYRTQARSIVEGEPQAEPAATLRDLYFRVLHIQAEQNGASVPCEHTPQNVFYIDEILDASPRARIIAMVRDPRDVVLSQRSKWRRWYLSEGAFPRREAVRAALTYHPINVALLWRAAARSLQAGSADPRVLVVRYEDLVADAEATTVKMCDFLELDWSANLLNVERHGSSRSRDNADTSGVRDDRSSAWRRASSRERADVVISQRLCRAQMAAYGYDAARLKVPWGRLAWQLASWPVRSLLGLLLNLLRVGSPFRAIRVRLKAK